MKNIKRLDEFEPQHTETSGGKGKSLSTMLSHKINVPNGFVILSSTFDNFLKLFSLNQEVDLILQSVDKNTIHTVEYASEKIQELILKTEFPFDVKEEIINEFEKMNMTLVAVRSSATAEDGIEHAWAGQLDTFLNINKGNLISNIQKCWASLYTPRAIFYRLQKELHTTSISVAVIIQDMVQSEVSGIAFSVHPVSEDTNELIIEAGYGLGEAMVSGKVTPDSYIVKKDSLKIIEKYISTQNKKLVFSEKDKNNVWEAIFDRDSNSQKLSDEQIQKLSKVIIEIESFYGRPQDIEWAYLQKEFYITQSRPITTLK
jgi:pyruvate,water dikinase